MPAPKKNKERTLQFRSCARVRPSTANEAERSIEFILATENPVAVRTWEHGIVEEILLMAGMTMPKNRQVPLQDTHSTRTVTDVLGSVREIRVASVESELAPALVGKLFFSKKQKAQEAFSDVMEGHLTDVSVGYDPIQSVFIPEGERGFVRGREYTGPVLVTESWHLLETSLAPIGADEGAKARSLQINSATRAEKTGGQTVKKLIELLIQRGLNPDATEEQALEFLRKLAPDVQTQVRAAAGLETIPEPAKQEPSTEPADEGQRVDPSEVAVRAIRQERERCEKIRSSFVLLGMGEHAEPFINSGATVESAREALIRLKSEKEPPVSVRVEHTADANVKRLDAFRDAILLRANIPVEKPAEGAVEVSRLSLENLARECLAAKGVATSRMDREAVFRASMTDRRPGLIGMSRAGVAAMTTSDFPYLLAVSAQKALTVGFDFTKSTFESWCRIASITDFKTVDRVTRSDVPILEQVLEGATIPRGSLSELREQYRIYNYALILPFTRECLINDDLQALQDLFVGFGASSKRLCNSLPYAVLTANAALDDGGLLFNSDAVTVAGGHANLSAAGAAPSTTTYSAARMAMGAQTGPKGSKLNLTPSFLLAGMANEDNALILLTSESLPTAGMSSGVRNIYRNTATPIIDAEISGNEWYIVASPMIAATMEVGFLNGRRTPTIEDLPISNDILGMDFRGYIDVGAKAIGFRGLYKNPGQA